MIDIKLLRNNPDLFRQGIKKKGEAYDIEPLLALDARRREILVEVEGLRADQKKAGQQIPILKKEGKDASELLAQLTTISERTTQLDEDLRGVDAEIDNLLLYVPNLPHPDVPAGAGEDENVERPGSRWGEPRKFDFEPKPHWEIGEGLGILNFERGVKVSGSRSYITYGLGCKLTRALIAFMIDVHVKDHGYTEVYTPYLVLRESMVGTGQLPKFEEDAFRTDPDDLFLIPTGEVPVTNMLRDEILDPGTLPLNYVTYTACFRREAGAAGRDTRGIIRVHQFDKVEMVKFVAPETSYDEYDRLTDNACEILRCLGLPYRIMDMCTGDLGFTAAKKCDPEAWMPSRNAYLEISSCSNFEDFQARRISIRYRPEQGAKPQFVHTLNGSGLAVSRTLAAILENYQEADGSVRIPAPLIPYMDDIEKISP